MSDIWRPTQKVLMIFIALSFMVGLASSVQAASERDNVVEQPASDLWREVRQKEEKLAGNTQVGGVDSGVLIRAEGEAWRQFRMQKLVPYSISLVSLTILAILAFYLLRGKIMVDGGMSGVKIPRFTKFQRIAHWTVAVLFVLLAITGILLTLGRTLLLPLIGQDAFSMLAYVAKRIHNFTGPLFGLSLLVMIFGFFKGNLPASDDIKWFCKLGGFFGQHASSGRYNAAEKLWYWMVVLVGILVVGSGLVLDFPNYGQSRNIMSVAHILHSVSAILIFMVSLGHIYIGTIGSEGSLEAMTTGYCDENWAKEHHDLWHEEMKAAGKIKAAEDEP